MTIERLAIGSTASRWPLAVASGIAFLVATAVPQRAQAYAWMIRYGYAECATCHVDPSGGGLPTAYGRAQGVLLLASRWGQTDDEAAVKAGEFLFGAFELPDELALGGDVRPGAFAMSVDGQSRARALLMQADVEAGLHVDRFRSGASVGFASDGAFAATVVGDDNGRLISRTHWAGVDIGADHQWLLRAGRINLPYGLRIVEHTAWVRRETRTDINVSQQHGAALAYSGQGWRGEAMAIAGNYQVSPDAYRERGYSAFIEAAPDQKVAVGVSSLVTHAELDPTLQSGLWRQAHGAFVRYAPDPWIVLSAEADFLMHSQPSHNAFGLAAFVQADAELTQGLHLILSLESNDHDFGLQSPSWGAWASVGWFFFPHADLRIDGQVQRVELPGMAVTAEALVGQLHFYL